MIAERLGRALARWSPASVAVIGCAGGNGLDKIAGSSIERVVALDVNPEYIERTRARHANRLLCMGAGCADLQSESLTHHPADFTFAALLFEYVDVRSNLTALRRNSRPDAVSTAILQLPHSAMDAVSASPYRSLGSLVSVMTWVAPEALCQAAAAVGFTATDSTNLKLPSGKSFCVQNARA